MAQKKSAKAPSKSAKKKPKEIRVSSPVAVPSTGDGVMKFEAAIAGTVSTNTEKGTAHIGVHVLRSELQRDYADKLLVNATLQVWLRGDPNSREDAAGQSKLTDDDIEASFVGTVKQFTTDRTKYKFGIDMPIDGLDLATLSRFGGLSVVVSAKKLGAAVEEKPAGDGASEDGDTADLPFDAEEPD